MDYNKTEDAIFKRAMEIFKKGAVIFWGIDDKITSPVNIDIKTNSINLYTTNEK